MSDLTAHARTVLKNALGADGELGRQTVANILAPALARISELEAALRKFLHAHEHGTMGDEEDAIENMEAVIQMKRTSTTGALDYCVHEFHVESRCVECELEAAQARIAELEAALDELRQSLIGGIEGVRAGRPMDKWADANERLLKAIRARGSK